ncbi:MAG TPA: hypothetical protein PK103_05595 [Elusimicrobiales bacterium]|nr:hypothetical protein [Elusimicrobiales bacterium]HOL62821.1 hypothetical protein [Elusimicrobiales bacterium]HPO95743.1 hypothetical protein [Elusimicrobiales bacterium]
MKLLFLYLFFAALGFCESFEDVYNRIITDKFFRGVVADNIIENDKYKDVVEGNFYTYSELRARVMNWIEEDPKEAAKRFLEIVDKKGEYGVRYQIYDYKINPKLKELIDKMEFASKNDIKDEKIRDYASLLFEGFKENDSQGVEIKKSSKKQDYSKTLSYNYVNINADNLYKEAERVNKAYDYLKNIKIEDIGGIIEKTDWKHKEFLEYVSVLKGSRRISLEQGERLKKILDEVSRFLSLKALLVKYSNIKDLSDIPKYKVSIAKIKSDLESYYLLKSDNFNRDFLNLYSFMDNIERESVFINKIKEIKTALSYDIYSCFLDYLVKSLSSIFSPGSKYSDYKKKKKKLYEYFSKFYENLVNSHNETNYYEDAEEKIKEALKIVELENGAGYKNRKLQFLFCDNLLPWDLYWDKKGKYFGLKIDVFREKK